MKKAILLLALLYFSCREIDVAIYDPAAAYDPTARINPGFGMDGVILGNTPEKVRQILGQESYLMNWDGVNDGGEGVGYETGEHKDLAVYFSHDQNNNSIVFVQSMTVTGNYAGKTKDGIGIGSTIDEVVKYYGIPNKSIVSQTDAHSDYYCINSRMFIISYQNNIIHGITIKGYQKRSNDVIDCQ